MAVTTFEISENKGFDAQIAVLVAVAAVVTYVPFLPLPLLPDDYLQVHLARRYVSIPGLNEFLADPLYRCRATSLLLTRVMYDLFGLSAPVFHVSSVVLHALNSILVYLLGTYDRIGWRLAAISAIIVAMKERHHEAVIWFAALPELLVFFFGLLAILCWIVWLKFEAGRGWYLLACTFFIAALASKESAVAVVPLMMVFAMKPRRDWQRIIIAMPSSPLLPLRFFMGSESMRLGRITNISMTAHSHYPRRSCVH